MKKIITEYQDGVLKLWGGKVEGFYLGGATPLTKFYFHHRESLDLGFFTKEFDRHKPYVLRLIEKLSEDLGKNIELAGEETRKDRMKMLVFYIPLAKQEVLEIDFVEDWLDLIKPLKNIDGINVLSLEDIYIRKIYTITGSLPAIDTVGRKVAIGKREEAKDFYDLYFLSHTFMELSRFTQSYCDQTRKETIIRWFRSYDRMHIKTGLLDLKVKKDIDYNIMEKHFQREIDKIVEGEVDFL